MDAGQNLDERRFARAIVADKCHDFAGMHIEVDIRQCRDGAEVFGDPFEAEHKLAIRGSMIGSVTHDSPPSRVEMLSDAFGFRPPKRPGSEKEQNSAADAKLLAAVGIAVDAELVRRLDRLAIDGLVDDLGLEVFRRDQCWREKLGRRIEELRVGLRCRAGEQLDRDIGCCSCHDLARLGDGIILVAGNDELQAGDGRVVTRHRWHRIEAGSLEGRDGGTTRTVIGGDDAEDLLAETGDLAACPLLRLRRRPFRRVEFRQHRIAAFGETGMDTLLDQAGGSIGRRTVDFKETAVASLHTFRFQVIDQRLGDHLADLFIVERDIVVGSSRRDRTVIGYDLHALALRELHQRGGGRRIHRIEHDCLRALRDRRVELLLLTRGVAVGILIDDLAAGAELLHLGLEAREIMLFIASGTLIGHQEGHGRVSHLGGLRKGGGAGQKASGKRGCAGDFQCEMVHWNFSVPNGNGFPRSSRLSARDALV
ncbi:hypothetical protein RHSP_39463 [Rhizobium freirei PRF 81]|uniref:Uncharacterized protein n=1 Tax=Rhizobium freirei PRF 81 TaxID=363754 RepID=N6UDA5_9HYPH|nr:hypothetical protein RHSP_39463 [Rhizobium freirei PRF 81]